MRKVIFIFLVLIPVLSYTQEKLDFSSDFVSASLDRDFLIENERFTKLVEASDLSDSWNMTKDFGGKDRKSWNIYSHQGIFGKNYQRIDFFIYEVKKSKNDPYKYLVKGKSRLKANVCDFSGEINIIEIRRFKETGNSKMHSMVFSDTTYNGVIVADYKFYEDKNQYGSGIFQGKFASGVFVYPNYLNFSRIGSWNEINETNMYGTFVGIWKGYKSDIIKKCIWNYYTDNYPYSGDFHRIPNTETEAREKEISSVETPLSADELFGKGINPKYRSNGWNIPSREYNKDWWK